MSQDRKTPQTADEWKAAIENAKWEKGDLARGFMENLLGERRDTSKDEPIPLPDFLKRPEDREKPPPPPENPQAPKPKSHKPHQAPRAIPVPRAGARGGGGACVENHSRPTGTMAHPLGTMELYVELAA